ncbi:hypothetical protein [Rhodococcus sp. T7]|uniref:hypothetical protein n=1 Tax=Rhodococcus sp. T7 TaxID=627444 RepID=UPI00135C47DB|nr:hypothetical protein [Rhodococcus sp. T7]KAF0963467.1 hypothetical protein MLGJGCBP_03402 [Rhodococcus sp. T7]
MDGEEVSRGPHPGRVDLCLALTYHNGQQSKLRTFDEFSRWQPTYHPKPWRKVSPPQPVTVDLACAIAHDGGRLAHDLPLRVRAEGLNLDIHVPPVAPGHRGRTA